MKRVKKINTIKNWADKLYFIFYDLYFTDLIMHKHGVFYEQELYQKKTIVRLQNLFCKLRKIIKKSKYEEMITELKKLEEKYFKILEEDSEKWLGKKRPLRVFIPEKVTECSVFAMHMAICNEILERVEKNKVEKTEIDSLLKTNIRALKNMHKYFREDLKDYGYIIKKEKEVKHLRKKHAKIV